MLCVELAAAASGRARPGAAPAFERLRAPRRRAGVALRPQHRARVATAASSWSSTARPAPSGADAPSAPKPGEHGRPSGSDCTPVNATWSPACRTAWSSTSAAGVAALARPGEVLVTRTVVDLVAGSGLRFTDRGMHVLAKGHKGWRVYAVRED